MFPMVFLSHWHCFDRLGAGVGFNCLGIGVGFDCLGVCVGFLAGTRLGNGERLGIGVGCLEHEGVGVECLDCLGVGVGFLVGARLGNGEQCLGVGVGCLEHEGIGVDCFDRLHVLGTSVGFLAGACIGNGEHLGVGVGCLEHVGVGAGCFDRPRVVDRRFLTTRILIGTTIVRIASAIVGTFSRGDKRVWKCIPVPNGLGGGEATLTNISVSNPLEDYEQVYIVHTGFTG